MAISAYQSGLNCQKCSDNEKVDNGCRENSPIEGRWKIENIELQRCPLSQVTYQSRLYLEAYTLFKLGILPNGDGWMNESKKFMDAMRIIQREVSLSENKNAK